MLAVALGDLQVHQRQLLDERVRQVIDTLEHPEFTSSEAADLATARRLSAGKVLNDPAVDDRLQAAPTAYLLSHEPEELARQARLVEPLPRPGTVRVSVSPNPEPDRWTVDIACRDSRGLLARLTDVLADFGIVAKQHASELEETDDAFLCFQRRSTGDVVVGSYKVCGSAQRRHHQSMLQHGSVLLARSVHAPELPGLEDLHGAAIAVDELREAWLAELVKRLGFALVPGELTESERQAAERVMFERYAADSWNRKR